MTADYNDDEQAIDDQLYKRLTLLNQYLILAAVDPAGRDSWERAADNLQRHRPVDELPYVDMLRSYAKAPFTTADRSELLDTLDLFEVLQDAEDAGLTVAEKGWTSFPGYSGNEETGHLSYYRDIVKDGERWPSLRRSNPKDLNSHFPLRDSYKRMVKQWKTLGSPRKLSQADFDSIQLAAVHPSNR